MSYYLPPEMAPDEPPARPLRPRRRPGWSVRLTTGGVLLLLLLNGIILGLLAWPLLVARLALPQPPTPSQPPASPTTTLTPSLTPSATPTPTRTPRPGLSGLETLPASLISLEDGLIILALDEGNNTHLFAYQPLVSAAGPALPFTRLTGGPWDDIHPALSPDGRKLAFASNRSRYWDLYILDLPSGTVQQLTNSPEYDGSPSWSPDGLWLAYETYLDDNLEVVVRPIDDSQPPIRLTNNQFADYAPVWSPQGRQLGLVSTRAGQPDIWLVDLDRADESQFQNLTHSVLAHEANPVWSPDGNYLAWAAVQDDGQHSLLVWDGDQPQQPARLAGSGDWPAWSPDGETLLAVVYTPHDHFITAYPFGTPELLLPPVALPGLLEGLAWGAADLPYPLHGPYRQAALLSPTPLWQGQINQATGLPPGRHQVSLLEDIEAPQPYLHDAVDESFQALRTSLSTTIGWDFLATLDNAYVPLTGALPPGLGQDWLYTGRAFAVTGVPINAGWMVVVRQDFGLQTYWRVYLRTRFQDGSSGRPLRTQPWDFSARLSGNIRSYEAGGQLAETPLPGYWIDFTQTARAYGWLRVPALTTWRAAYPATRFNEFVLPGGLDWRSAMLELYPPEALITPSPVVPPTRTPTPTSRWLQTSTPTQTRTPRPTFTPVTPSPTPTDTPTITPTPPPSATTIPTETATPRPTATRTRLATEP